MITAFNVLAVCALTWLVRALPANVVYLVMALFVIGGTIAVH